MSWLLGLCFTICLLSAEEKQPPAEYPYPQDVQGDHTPESVEKPKSVGIDGSYQYKKKGERKIHRIEGVPAPEKVDSEGAYYYGDSDEKKIKTIPGVTPPEDKSDDGEYDYGTSSRSKNRDHTVEGVSRPTKVTSDGAYLYNQQNKAYSKALFFRIGLTGPFDIRSSSASSTVTYQDVYSDTPELVFNLEYEWKLFDFLGDTLFKIGTGLSFVTGSGRFANPALNPGIEPRESFQFLLFPNIAMVTYKFNYSDTQMLVPYVEAGGGYFAFIERRTDGDQNFFGGAPVIAGSVGILFNLDSIGMGIDPDEGYSRSWLDIQFRQIIGLDERKNFTSSMITGGLALGF